MILNGQSPALERFMFTRGRRATSTGTPHGLPCSALSTLSRHPWLDPNLDLDEVCIQVECCNHHRSTWICVILIAIPIFTITTTIPINPTPGSLSTTSVHHGHGLPLSPSSNEDHNGQKDGRFGGVQRSKDAAWTFVMLLCRLVVSLSLRFAVSQHTAFLRPSAAIGASDTSGRIILWRSEGKEAQKERVKGGKERRRLEDEERVDGG
jgi:hypothetical protein